MQANGKTVFLLIAVMFGCALWPQITRADDLSFTLQDSTISGAPGSTIPFMATLANTSSTDTISICNTSGSCDSYSLNSSYFTGDDAPFSNVIFDSFTPSFTTGSVDILDISISSLATPGTYGSNSFTVYWTDASGNSQSTTDDFSIDVTSTSAVPEPATILLLLTGLLGFGFLRWRRTA